MIQDSINMAFTIQFLGGVETVTGSKYLLTHNNHNILVDCGLFQGLKNFRLKNWEPLPIKASDIDAVLLTHAHIDHSGYIPRLIKEGFRGKIYATPATRDVCRIVLPDCGFIMEEEASYLTEAKKTKHSPALPLFTKKEAEQSLTYVETVPFETRQKLFNGFEFEFRYAGHILGAASVAIKIDQRTLTFTGDVGRMNDEIFYPPKKLPQTDYLITESTYGNRLHSKLNFMDELSTIIQAAEKNKSVVLIPAFAVGRAISIMHCLAQLRNQKRIGNIPIYLNSPMANEFNDVFFRHQDLHRLTREQQADIFTFVKSVRSTEESIALNKKKGPMIIVAASGMITGGRILHHLKQFMPNTNNSVLLTGYQAVGTRGESLANGAKEIKIHGEYVPVRAEIKILDMLSAHADYQEMIQWFEQSKISPKRVFITHGDPSASDEFRRRLHETFGWNCTIPRHNDQYELEST